MVLVLTHPASYKHQPPGHPERPERIAAIEAALGAHLPAVAVEQLQLAAAEPVAGAAAAEAAAAAVHHPRYVEAIFASGAKCDRTGEGGWIDGDTYIGPGSLEAACASVLTACEAVRRVLEAPSGAAFSFCRPPGHHATRNQAMGFCFFNNVAAAAQAALGAGLQRVAIVDFDVHHGNGTQDIFYERDDVFYVSTHQWPLYPGTGASTERGRGDGEGYTLNYPLPAGTGDEEYARLFDEEILPALFDYGPELVLVSAGFDADGRDPLAGMELTTDGFAALARRLLEVAGRVSDGRSAWILEGGYDLDALGSGAAAIVREASKNG